MKILKGHHSNSSSVQTVLSDTLTFVTGQLIKISWYEQLNHLKVLHTCFKYVT